MTRPILIIPSAARPRSEKFDPGVQELRIKFAHIKRELRQIQRTLSPRPRSEPLNAPPSKA